MTPPPNDAEPRSYDHASAQRPNQPTAETSPLMSDDDRAPVAFDVARRLPQAVADAQAVELSDVNLNRDLRTHPVLAWDRQGATSQINGDAEADAAHAFAGVPLYTREKVTPALLVEQLRRGDTSRVMQLDFDGLGDDALEWEWYQHAGHWQNRLVHGDSAAVMQSLLAKDRLRGQVQMIYFDPPYGQNFKSNFQTSVAKLETPEKLDGLPVGDTMPLRAFRDSYRNGLHSYLDGIHARAVLARELLTDTGSLFVQIGDINVHRLALVLDEVFGPENRVATITWRPTAGSSARTLPESASYLLWYAKEKQRCKYRQPYEPLDRAGVIELFSWHAMLQTQDEPARPLTATERNQPNQAFPEGAVLYRRMNLTSAGSSTTGRTRTVEYDGQTYFCGTGKQWRVSVHVGDGPVCTPPANNGARTEASPPCPDPEPCGLCWLGWSNRIDDSGRTLQWKWYESEVPGRRVDNVWHRMSLVAGRTRRYVVQTSASIIERCMLMTTDPGDLVLDPTCGSGVTADVAEEWGRRWVTIDVSRVAIAVARQKLATSVYTWHRTADGGTDPAADFVCKQMPKVSAGRLADPNTDWDHPDNVIKLVDQTETESKRVRLASPFTVESHSPYSYLPFDTAPAGTDSSADDATTDSAPSGHHSTEPDGESHSGNGASSTLTDSDMRLTLGIASGEGEQSIIDALYRSPVCDPSGAALLHVVDHERWPGTHLASHGVTCARPGRDTHTTAGLMIAAPDATVTAAQVARAAVEARQNAPDCADLIAVGFAFDPDVPANVGACTVHRVIASKDLQIPELAKNPDGGTFTLLGEPDCEVRRTSDGTSLVVRLLGCDTYDPQSGRVRETNLDRIDCWMVDTDHDQMSFVARLTHFPNGLRNDAGLKAAMRSLAGDLAPDAEAQIIIFQSKPFPIPP